MALYRGTIQVSGGGSGGGGNFNPENQGSVGQILTKTATGYDWETGSGGPTYTAGANITIDANNEISATDTTYVAGDFDIKDLADTTGLRTTWSGKADAADINTKTFYLSSTSDLTTAQAAYDWYKAGKEPIIVYDKDTYITYNNSDFPTHLSFVSADLKASGSTVTTLNKKILVLAQSSDIVNNIQSGAYTTNVLRTDYNYPTPYTPQYNGSPATKKYVDDSLSAKISAGTTAPSNPTEGQLWYDSTNDVLKVYDGTQWNSVGGGGGGGSYTAGANIDITNDVISAENVIVTDAVNSTGFKIEDNNDNFTDVGLSNAYEIKVGNEQDDQQGNYDYTDVDLIGSTGTIGGRNYHETPSIEDHREYYITPEGIEATREITSGGTTTTTTENYYWIDDGLGNTDEKIAKLGDIVTYSAGANISIDANNEISATDTIYSAGDGIGIDANNQISNTLPGPVVSATAPSNPSEGDTWYDTTNDIFKTYDGTNWNVTSDFPGMTILSYGHSTWQDFINAYNENAIVYCRASSNSNPATGNQTRMAFMAYVNSATPTEVEFQYYRSRSDHNTAANQLDQVFVYKLTSASGGTWTVTERNTAAKAVAGTGISLAFGSGNVTITNDAPFSPGSGTTGQVLTKTASGYEWANASATAGVTSLGNQTGAISLGDGLNMSGTTLDSKWRRRGGSSGGLPSSIGEDISSNISRLSSGGKYYTTTNSSYGGSGDFYYLMAWDWNMDGSGSLEFRSRYWKKTITYDTNHLVTAITTERIHNITSGFGAPSGGVGGDMYFNNTTSTLMVNDGTSRKTVQIS